MRIELWCTGEESLSSVLISYALPFLKSGKGTWSLAALTSNKRFDLLSLDPEGSTLWKGKAPLSKVQLEREQLLRRIFGFAGEKEKAIGPHETLAKLQWSNGNVVYFILRDALTFPAPSNAHLLLEQEITIENIQQIHAANVLRPRPGRFEASEELLEAMGKLGVSVKREEELSKRERERFLKSVIDKLQSELEGKQSELLIYRSQQAEPEEDLPIPSERVSMGQERYMQLQRQIRE